MSKDKEIKRVPLHKQNVFVADKREGFQRMWINDTPMEINRYQLAGWVLVQDPDMKTHDSLSQVESQFDSVCRRVVNKDPNAPVKHNVLVEIPLHLYEADLAEEEAERQKQERLRMQKSEGQYGDISVTR